MTEQGKNDKYIKCSRCRMIYYNNDNAIKQHFGYNRLDERFKTCVKCRQYRLDNREKILQQGRERAKDYYEENKDKILESKKEYREQNKDKINAKEREQVTCDLCDANVCRGGLARHKRTLKCKHNCNK